MKSFSDVTELYVNAIEDFKKGKIQLDTPLEEIVLRESSQNLAYVDNRGAAKKMGFDFWKNVDLGLLKSQNLSERLLYSESQQFPDFLFKTLKKGMTYSRGSLMELKDSKGTNISSFNSTIPTKTKTLEEIDMINGNNLISKIACIIDGELHPHYDYMKFERKCYYFVRTNRESEKVKLSIIDGAFFETIPKEHLFHEMLLNVYHRHLEKKHLTPSKETMDEVETALKCIDDQSIIACSQIIDKASIRPRLRIMAEVHPEGNPHSSFYPRVTQGSFNLILQSTKETMQLKEELLSTMPDLEVFVIRHKRNGDHIVFQYCREKPQTHL